MPNVNLYQFAADRRMKKETTIFPVFRQARQINQTLAIAHGAKQSKHYRKKRRAAKTKKRKETINEQKCTLNWLARRTWTFTFLHRTGPRKTDRAKKFIVGKLSIRYYEHT